MERRHLKLVSAKNYDKTMKEIVEPYLARIRKVRYFERKPGERIYFDTYPAKGAVGAIVISHGMGESAVKYYEPAFYFHQMGYTVYVPDHRGHGRSYRSQEDFGKIYVNSYKDYILDMNYLLSRIVKKEQKGDPLYLYGHSMGGGIAAAYLEEYPRDFKKAILSSPMITIREGHFPNLLIYLIAGVMRRVGRKTHYAAGQGSFKEKRDFKRSASADISRYDYYFDKIEHTPYLQSHGATYSWAQEAVKLTWRIKSKRRIRRVSTPVLLFTAGKDHLVRDSGQRKYIRHVKDGTWKKVRGVKHEIYTGADEVIRPYWREIFHFLSI